MGIGAPLVAQLQSLEPIQPAQCPLYHPSHFPKTLPTLHTTSRDARNDPTHVQRVATATTIKAFVRVKLVRPLAGPPTSTVSDTRHSVYNSFEHPAVVYVRCRDDHSERQAIAIHNDMSLAAQLAPVGGVWTGFFATTGGSDGRRVKCGTAPVNSAGRVKLIEQEVVKCCPDANVLPLDEPSPAGHPTAVAERLRKVMPRDAGVKHEQNAFQNLTAWKSRTATVRSNWCRREDGFNQRPEIVGQERHPARVSVLAEAARCRSNEVVNRAGVGASVEHERAESFIVPHTRSSAWRSARNDHFFVMARRPVGLLKVQPANLVVGDVHSREERPAPKLATGAGEQDDLVAFPVGQRIARFWHVEPGPGEVACEVLWNPSVFSGQRWFPGRAGNIELPFADDVDEVTTVNEDLDVGFLVSAVVAPAEFKVMELAGHRSV